jgi:hypothetical protein
MYFTEWDKIAQKYEFSDEDDDEDEEIARSVGVGL